MERKEFYKMLGYQFALSEEDCNNIEQLLLEYPVFHAGQTLLLQNKYGSNEYQKKLINQRGFHILDTKYYYQNLMYNKKYIKYKYRSDKNKTHENQHITVKKKDVLQYAPTEYKLIDLDDNFDIIDKNQKRNFNSWLLILEEGSSVTTKNKTQDIAKHINRAKKVDKTENIYSSGQLMSQTLAEIYVSQKLYDLAIRVYEKLYLTDKEKNITFAHRIDEIKELKNK